MNFVCSIPCIKANFMKKATRALVIRLYTFFINHTYMFRPPSATILRVYNIKNYGESVQDIGQIRHTQQKHAGVVNKQRT
jgi:hypothetical protein